MRVVHATQVSQPNNPGRSVSATAWNEDHEVEGSYADRAAASAATISEGVNSISVSQFDLSYDDGAEPADYREVENTGPLLPWQFRSNVNTRRWGLSYRDIDPRSAVGLRLGDYENNVERLNDLFAAVDGAGSRIFIPAGDPIMVEAETDTSALYVYSNTEIFGVTGKSTIKLRDAKSATSLMRIVEDATGVTLRGFVLDGNRANQTPADGTFGSYMGLVGSAGTDGILVADMVFKNMYGRSLVANQFSGVAGRWRVKDSVILNGGTKGFHARQAAWFLATGCYVETYGVPDGEVSPGFNNTDNCAAFESSNSEWVMFANCQAKHLNAPWGVTCRATNSGSKNIFNGIQGTGGRQFASFSTSHVILTSFYGADSQDGMLIQAPAGQNIEGIIISNGEIYNPTGYGATFSMVEAGNGSLRAKITDVVLRGAGAMTYGLRNPNTEAEGVRITTDGCEIYNANDGDITGYFIPVVGQNGQARQVTIADDQKATIDCPRESGNLIITIYQVPTWNCAMAFRCSAGSQSLTQLWGDSADRMDQTTGTLSAGDGVDGNITFSARSDRKIDISNRAGTSRVVTYQFQGAV